MDDLISRQAVINKAIMIPVARIVTEDKVIWRKAVFVEDIEALPSVDAVPVRRGRWIYHPDWEIDGGCGYECSRCGMGSEVNYKYCMRCGADMRGEDADE